MKKIVIIFAFFIASMNSFGNNESDFENTKDCKIEIFSINNLDFNFSKSYDFARCLITHNVYNTDGVLVYSATYRVEASDCQAASNQLTKRTIDRYNELFN